MDKMRLWLSKIGVRVGCRLIDIGACVLDRAAPMDMPPKPSDELERKLLLMVAVEQGRAHQANGK